MGPEADEEAFKRLAPGRHVLHLATHGFFVGGECEAVGKRPASPGARGFGLRSGLALSGANHRDDRAPSGNEDGVLTGEEIGSLDLSRAELVVLSACNSGIGQPADAEGVFGLRRAFQASGVRSLVMSLWAVRDRAAGAWMEAFYREFLTHGRGTAGAAAAASRSILDSRRKDRLSTHPFFWGGFIAIGESH
jgi:CHAT domain-containing protein